MSEKSRENQGNGYLSNDAPPVVAEQKTRSFTKLQQALKLDGSPVAVAIIADPPGGLKHLPDKTTVCMMVQIARRGDVFYSSGKNILCGGRANLGMGEPTIRKLDDFLVRKEKLFSTETAARTLLDSTRKRAPLQGEYMAFSPLEKAPFIPDVVLFVATPAQISRIIFLNAFETGEIDTVHGEPLCSGAIAAPMTTAKIGISFLDMSCRQLGGYRPEEMIIGVPYPRLSHIVSSIELSSAGTAKPAVSLQLAENIFRKRILNNVWIRI